MRTRGMCQVRELELQSLLGLVLGGRGGLLR